METLTSSTIETKTNEILTKHGLDFTIEKKPLYIYDSENNPINTGYFGLLNTKSLETINTVKDSYVISQNRDVVELALRGMENFGSQLSVEKAGSLNGGRKVFLQLAIEGESKVNQDTIKRYVTILDSNDGSTALAVGISDLTMSCQNQFAKFYKLSDAKFRHSNSLTAKIKTIPSLIEIALCESLKQIELYNKFASTTITKDLANKLVKYVLGFDKVYTSVMDLSEKSTRSINIMESIYDHINKELLDKDLTLWGLHSGITSYTTHEISTPKRENARIESILNGSAYNMNMSSLQFCTNELHLS